MGNLQSERDAQDRIRQGMRSEHLNRLGAQAHQIGLQSRQSGPISKSEGQRLRSRTPNALDGDAGVSVVNLAVDAMEVASLFFDLTCALESQSAR